MDEIVFLNDNLNGYNAHYLNGICVNYLGIDLDKHNHPATPYIVAGHLMDEIVFLNDNLNGYNAHYLNGICVNYLGIDLDKHNHPATM